MNIEQLTTSTSLTPVLREADVDDLSVLVDYITDSGDGRLTLATSVCSQLVVAKATNNYAAATRTAITDEILAFGGNTLGNMVRSLRATVPFGTVLDKILPDMNEKVSYVEVVRDVASHLKIHLGKEASVVDLETAILLRIMRESFTKMSADERRQVIDEIGAGDTIWGPGAAAAALVAGRLSGFATYKLATIVANSAARALIGRGLTFAATGGAMRALSVALGPIGWAITGLWTLADLSAPAYRVTVPCVLQVAYIRQKLIMQATHVTCDCGAVIPHTVKFCPECGKSAGRLA